MDHPIELLVREGYDSGGVIETTQSKVNLLLELFELLINDDNIRPLLSDALVKRLQGPHYV
jgi:hypothetical protein